MVAIPGEAIGAAYAAPITFDDWIANYPEDKVTELINGELVSFPFPDDRHQGVLTELGFQFVTVTKSPVQAEVWFGLNVRLSAYDGPIPELVVYTGEAGGTLTEYGIDGPPDLVVEILDEWSRKNDLIDKSVLYAKSGIPEYWIVDPEEQVLIVCSLASETYSQSLYREGIVHCSALDGAAINVSSIWNS